MVERVGFGACPLPTAKPLWGWLGMTSQRYRRHIEDDRQLDLSSRIPKHKSTNRENRIQVDTSKIEELEKVPTYKEKVDRFLERENNQEHRPLSVNGVKLRPDSVEQNDTALTWGEITKRWLDWLYCRSFLLRYLLAVR